MARNPNWTRDELILALDLYFRIDVARTSQDHSEIVELSQLLKTLPIHTGESIEANFRSPNSVYMKLCNFLRLDPHYPGKGLDAGSKLDVVVWNDFSGDQTRLAQTAAAIRENLQTLQANKHTPFSLDDDEEFLEGRLLERLHKARERNLRLAQRKKEQALAKTGKLACEVCGFDFATVYGELGKGFAECHHLVPLSELRQEKRARLSDLAIVCANCHRMLHRGSSRKTLAELQALVSPGVRL